MLPAFFSPVANHLWQSTVFVIAAGLLVKFLTNNQARVRYWIWLIASLKFLLPFSLLVNLGGRFSWLTDRVGPVEPSVAAAFQQVAQPFTSSEVIPIVSGSTPSVDGAGSFVLPLLVLAVWCSGGFALLFHWSSKWRHVRSVLRQATALTEGREFETLRHLETIAGRRKPIPIVSSPFALEPSVYGIFQPVLVWPAALTVRLDDEELEAILLHEVSHLRRRDNLAAMLHMITEAIFWFHPLVWWIGTRLISEREKACDEDVLRCGGTSEAYAEGILKVCEFCVESPLVCASGIGGSDLKNRIEEIMKNQLMPKLSVSRLLLLVVAAITALGGPIMLGITHATASRTQSETASVQSDAVVQLPRDVPRSAAPIATSEQSPVVVQSAEARIPPAIARTGAPPIPRVVQDALEVITIRSSVPDPYAPPGARGGLVQSPSGRGGPGPGGCKGGPPSFEANRMTLNNNSLFTLITWAYGMNCLRVTRTGALVGGEDWVGSDQWVIQAIIPQTAGVQLTTGRPVLDPPLSDPKLQKMVAALLADRFKLALHRETREVPAYVLVVANGGPKLRSDAPFGADVPTPPGMSGMRMGPNTTMETLANFLTLSMQRPVTDRTGITGGYPITVFYPYSEDNGFGSRSLTVVAKALEEQLGLTLQETKTTIDILVIDHAEKPVLN